MTQATAFAALKVCQENKAAIDAALKSANGKAKTHTYTEFDDIESIANRYEKIVAELVGAKSRAVGAKVSDQSGAELPNAYKYRREVTVVTLERRSTGWFLINAACVTGYKDAGKSHLYLTPAQDEAAHAQLRKLYTVSVA